MSRLTFLLGAGVALVALAFAFTDWTPSPRQRVTERNARRIASRMRLVDVKAVLGRPADFIYRDPILCPPELFRRSHFWFSEEGELQVSFTEAGIADAVCFTRAERSGFLTNLRAWLGW